MAKKNTKKSKNEIKLETVDNFVNVVKEKKPSEILSDNETDKEYLDNNIKDINEKTIINNKTVDDSAKKETKVLENTIIEYEETKDKPDIKQKSFKEVFGYNMMGMIYD